VISDGIEDSVWKLSKDAPADFSANFLTGLRVGKDPGDMVLDLIEKFDTESGTFLFVKEGSIV